MNLPRYICVVLAALSVPTNGMGVLTVGTPLKWPAALPHLRYVRQHGVLQFINKYNEVKDIRNDQLLWGDEIEYSIVALGNDKVPRISLRAAEVRLHVST